MTNTDLNADPTTNLKGKKTKNRQQRIQFQPGENYKAKNR